MEGVGALTLRPDACYCSATKLARRTEATVHTYRFDHMAIVSTAALLIGAMEASDWTLEDGSS